MIHFPDTPPHSSQHVSSSARNSFEHTVDSISAQTRITELKDALRMIQTPASTTNNPQRTHILRSLSQIGARDQQIDLIDRAEALATVAAELNADEPCKYNNEELTAYDFAKMAVDLSLLAMPESKRSTNALQRLIPHPIHNIGILEEKPGEQRAPLTPDQYAEIKVQYPALTIAIQSSPQRKYTDAEYAAKGVLVLNAINNCELLLGIKEVPAKEHKKCSTQLDSNCLHRKRF
jgi:hypothetical protein